jgi:ribonucleoside-diphosphate reductase alpha chain
MDVQQLLKDRYFLDHEKAWSDISERISIFNPNLKNAILEKEFIPSTPTIMNANTNGARLGTLSSCFPMNIEDSIDSISDAQKECNQTTKLCGGVGFDFSSLRSSLESIKTLNNAKSSGPLPFIGQLNASLDAIRQGGIRRGAGMALLSIYHPNILDFIRAKELDDELRRLVNKGKIQAPYDKFNFSIKIPDEFYNDLENNPSKIHQVQLVTTGEYVDLIDNNKPVTVQMLWDEIIDKAWSSAEPGIFNYTTAWNNCSVKNVDDKVLPNPCLPDFVTLWTPEGTKQLKDIKIGDKIWSETGWTIVTNKWSTGIKSVYAWITNNKKDRILYATNNHEVVSKGSKVKLQDAKFIDKFWYNESRFTTPRKIRQCDLIGEMEVFDITVDNEPHTFWCNGFNISNCQEFVNVPYSSCNLGSINLSELEVDGQFDWDRYDELIDEAVVYLNNVIDNNLFPIDKIKETTLNIRPIGLGTMGLGDLLYKLMIPYNSVNFIETLYWHLTVRGMKKSIELAKERSPYPAFDYDIFYEANKRFFEDINFDVRLDINEILSDLKRYGIRNSCITSIAPTGSISTIAETSSGMEPVFALRYQRKVIKDNKESAIMIITNKVFESHLDRVYPNEKDLIMKEVIDNKGSCQNSKYLTEEAKEVFKTATDLTPMEHLETLAKIAKFTSLSVSKTINLPSDISKSEVDKVYRAAQKLGIIGVTVYRDGCRDSILTTGKSDDRIAPKRSKKLPAQIHKVKIKNEEWCIIIGFLNDEIFEIFAGKVDMIDIPKKPSNVFIIKKSSGIYQLEINENLIIKDISKAFKNDVYEGITRLISLTLRHNIPLKFIIETLNKAKGDITNFEKSISRALKKYIKEGTPSTLKCENCGDKLVYKDSCPSCLSCGWSKCG